MSTLRDLAEEHTGLGAADIDHLHRLAGDWQLLSDLSFADLLLWVPVRAPDGPFGAKGIGEAPVIAGPAAIANAIAAATGNRLFELPMTADRVWRGLRGAQ